MRGNLDRAAAHFVLAVAAEPVFGWRDRSVGAPADGPHGRRWLRVVSEQPQWARGPGWTGNTDANVLLGLPKPRVLATHEWAEGEWRHQRAEVMTFMPGTPVSPSDAAPPGLGQDLSPAWWTGLRNALARLAPTVTDRVNADQAKVDRRVEAAFGTGVRVRVRRWETVHGDLHWANLLNPLGILDWELWGRGPVGTDAATLYCYSLTAPALAQKVRDTFPVLDTPDGRLAQLHVAARLLHRIGLGDHPQLAAPLGRLVNGLLGAGR
ncbi:MULTISPECIES: aminoglycoside phosphotransferase [unclassified Streptomyces]|uniref:aminoglycoside phosphotransferase n=1 Tax=unclassified Streptomyces TaxID=2593676 RepID=UPI002E2ACD05|nr:aminoglycoside phosphotransferase [Streptomyces sp. NBC_00223]